MKILCIELKNLNSLYGAHKIDLEGELGDVPLFLIRGPTGAGKSTIMDAVALALFGVTPRLIQGRGKDEEDPRLIMSRGEWQASARVEVRLGRVGAEQRYRATWQCHRSRKKPDGNLQEARRILERWDLVESEWEQLISSTKRKDFEPVFNEALEGLNVQDFQRMILLAQGEFAAFLRADEAERGAILERLTSTERFRDIGQRANRRRQESFKRLEGITAELHGLELLSAEDEAQVAADLVEARTEEAARLAEFKQVRRWSDWRREQAKLKNLAAEAEAKLPELEEKKAGLEGRQGELTGETGAAHDQMMGARAEHAELEPEITAARQVKDRLGLGLEELERANKEQVKAARSAHQKERAAQGLEETDLTPGEIQERRLVLRDEGEALQKAARLLEREAELLDKQRVSQEQSCQAEEKLASAAEEITARDEALAGLQKQEATLEGQLKEAGWVRRLTEERSQLEVGAECPLCGSTEHPLLDSGGLEKVEERWHTLQQEKEALAQAVVRTNRERSALMEARGGATRDLDTSRKSLQDIATRLKELPGELAGHLELLGLQGRDGAALAARKDTYEATLSTLDKQSRAAAAYLELRVARDALVAADAELEKRKQTVAQTREQGAKVLGGRDPDQVDAALKGKIKAAELAWKALDKALTEGGLSLARVKTALEETGAQLVKLRRELDLAWVRLKEDLATLYDAECDAAGDAEGGADPDALRQAFPDVTLPQQLAALEEQARALSARVGELRGKLEEQERRKAKSLALAAKVQDAEQEHQLWLRLHKLIGERFGEAFRRFAQTLNLAELVGKANAHLARLSERYTLVAARDREGEPLLAFQVRDMYQAGEPRGLNTLSGGETFLVSLALALALADYGSARLPVETLLLDEGFGTLDGETLQVAMSALRNLNARGTQVGIISHVEALREAIPACVEVQKLGGGRSSVTVRPEG